jgi:hypothetical protein
MAKKNQQAIKFSFLISFIDAVYEPWLSFSEKKNAFCFKNYIIFPKSATFSPAQ